MNELMKFEFEGKAVRTVTNENGMTEWLGKDVAAALGYKDTFNALKRHCKKEGVAKRHLVDSRGVRQSAVFVNEANLYRLVLSSKLPSAEKFEKWVFETVLPSIRKHGGYIKPTATPEQITALMMEREHYKMLSEINEDLANTWKARSEYGERSNSNGLPKFLKRRGAWVADPRFKSSVILNFKQMTFSFAN
jgi:prophage antirepressor-like protein